MDKQIDLIGIGECLVEFNLAPGSTAEEGGLYQLGYAGDILNALSCAGHLGLSTGLISALGDDPFAEGLRNILFSEHIDLTQTPTLENKPNGVYFIDVGEFGAPTFHFLRKDSAATETFISQPMSKLVHYARSAKVLLLSSIPMAVMKERDRIFELLSAVKGHTTICYDLNVRRALWNDPQVLIDLLAKLVPLIDVLFVTNEDDRALFGDRDSNTAIKDYSDRGFSYTIFRRGSEPTVVGYRQDIFEVPVPRVSHIVDTTGAGDAFNAGFIAAMLRGHPPYECAAMGNAAAAVSIGGRGGRGGGITIDRVHRLYRPLIKWGTFHGPAFHGPASHGPAAR
jgi:2-dehydro-3-deoxygluconokinase